MGDHAAVQAAMQHNALLTAVQALNTNFLKQARSPARIVIHAGSSVVETHTDPDSGAPGEVAQDSQAPALPQQHNQSNGAPSTKKTTQLATSQQRQTTTEKPYFLNRFPGPLTLTGDHPWLLAPRHSRSKPYVEEIHGSYTPGYEHSIDGFEGSWMYLSAYAKLLAAENLGGKRLFQLDNPREPTAEQVYQLRERKIQAGELDPTVDIDIVWVPDQWMPEAGKCGIGGTEDEPAAESPFGFKPAGVRKSSVVDERSLVAQIPGSFSTHPVDGPWLLIPRNHRNSFEGQYNVGYDRANPLIKGSWEYFSIGSQSAEELAHTKFGGKADGLPGVDKPTAEQVLALLQRKKDKCAGIDLVWVPNIPLDANVPSDGDPGTREVDRRSDEDLDDLPDFDEEDFDQDDDDDAAPPDAGAAGSNHSRRRKRNPTAPFTEKPVGKCVQGKGSEATPQLAPMRSQTTKKQGRGGRARQNPVPAKNHPGADDRSILADRQIAPPVEETPDGTGVKSQRPPKPAPRPGVESRYDAKTNKWYEYQIGRAPNDVENLVDEAVNDLDNRRVLRPSVSKRGANSRQNSVAPPPSAATSTKKRGARMKFTTAEQAERGRSQSASAVNLSASSTATNLPTKSSLAGSKQSVDQTIVEKNEEDPDQDANSTKSRKKAKLEVLPTTEALAREPGAGQTGVQQDIPKFQSAATSVRARKTARSFSRRQSAAGELKAQVDHGEQAAAGNIEKTIPADGSVATASVARKRTAEQANVEHGGQDQNVSGADARKKAKHSGVPMAKPGQMNNTLNAYKPIQSLKSRRYGEPSKAAAPQESEVGEDGDAAENASSTTKTKSKNKKEQNKTGQQADAQSPKQDASSNGATDMTVLQPGSVTHGFTPVNASAEDHDTEDGSAFVKSGPKGKKD